jgi:hypothetical protein
LGGWSFFRGFNIKYGYPDGCRYLFDDRENENLIGKENMQYLKTLYEESGNVERHIIGWFLENYPLMKFLEKSPNAIPHITYEDMIRKPEKVENMLNDILGVSVSFTEKPSKTVKRDEIGTLAKRRSMVDFTYSLKKFTDDEKRRIHEIFDTFPQSLYSIED